MRPHWSKALRFRKAFRQLTVAAVGLLLAAPAFAQGASPWENAVSVLQQAFTSTIARGLSLVAIVVSGLTFAFGEGGSKRVLAGVLFGVGMTIRKFNAMNALQHHASTRTKDDIEKITHVYLDLDHGGTDSLQALENSDLVPRPNYVLNTSPEKYQVVWKVEGMTIEEAEALNHAMVREFDGDPAATDSTRVLRLPGFANKKYEADFYVQARTESTQTYHLRHFKLHIDSQAAPRHHEEVSRTQSAPSSTLTQSEHDWAYAKRALARGDDPEDVIRRITDYRATDKHDPAYYARHTVEKAQAEIGRRSASTGDIASKLTQEIELTRDQI